LGGQKYTKYNKINKIQKTSGGKIAAGGLSPSGSPLVAGLKITKVANSKYSDFASSAF